MKIRKKEPSVGILGKIINSFSSSKQATYSCDYINTALKEYYSMEEQVVGTWMGKPLYRKTLHITSGFAETMNVVHNISNLDITTNIYGTCYFFESWKPIPTIYLPDQANYDVSVYQITPIDIMLLIGKIAVSNITEAYITIEYTKTTE